eukprot:6033097-Prymnesium_polylepis.1
MRETGGDLYPIAVGSGARGGAALDQLTSTQLTATHVTTLYWRFYQNTPGRWLPASICSPALALSAVGLG